MKLIRKKYLFIIGLSVVIIALFLLFETSIKTDGYSVNNVYNTIKELSSDKYKGRGYGTQENMEAVKYIEEQFKKIGLEPAGDDGTYLQNYMEAVKVYNGMPVLELLDSSDNLVKRYKFGEDFTETGLGYDFQGEVISGYSSVNLSKDQVPKRTSVDKTIAIPLFSQNPKSNTDWRYIHFNLLEAGYKAMLLVTDDKTDISGIPAGPGERSCDNTGYEMPVLTIKARVADELSGYMDKGYKLKVKTTVSLANKYIDNVIGVIPGKSQETLLITAHLDHLGQSPDGTIFPGALDNASGTGAMLEIARYIKSQGKRPTKNIVFIAFNAEEPGLYGSLKYIRTPKYPLDRSMVINLDMIGSKKDIPLTIMSNDFYDVIKEGYRDPSSKQKYQLTILGEKLGVKTNVAKDNISDHSLFNMKGVSAVTLNDYDRDTNHTQRDDISNIGSENINRALKLALTYINSTAFSNGIIRGNLLKIEELKNFIKVQYPLLILLVITAVLCARSYIKNKHTKEEEKEENRGRLFLMTLVIILLCGIISYFPIRYPYVPTPSTGAIKLLVEGIYSMVKSALFYPLYMFYIIPGVILLILANHFVDRWSSSSNESKKYNLWYYISLISVVITAAIGNYCIFNREVYYPATPDFARNFQGKLLLHVIIGIIAFIICMVMQRKSTILIKGFKGLFIFSIIFIILLSAFFMPIAINKYNIDKNLASYQSKSISN